MRSPTGKPEQYNLYSAAPWPTWNVPPGYLTEHGFESMRLFGTFDRMELAGEGLLAADGCADAGRVTFYSDSDQRTRETGKALAAGFFPGCATSVRALPEGTANPLFHSGRGDTNPGDSFLETAAIAGRIGGDPGSLTVAYRAQLSALDQMLATCGASASDPNHRISLFDIPATLSVGQEGHHAELKGPLNTVAH